MSPYLPMKSVEVLLRVLAARVGVEHLPQVREHVLDPLHGRRVRVFQRLLHALELAVEHLPAQQVAELLELLPAPRATASRTRRAGGWPARCRSAARRVPPRGAARRRSGRGTARRARPPAPRRAVRGPDRASRRGARRCAARAAARGRGASGRQGRAGPASRAAAGRGARPAGCRRPGSARPSRRAPPGRHTAAPAGPAHRRTAPYR